MVMEKIRNDAEKILQEIRDFLNDKQDLDDTIDNIEYFTEEILHLIEELR